MSFICIPVEWDGWQSHCGGDAHDQVWTVNDGFRRKKRDVSIAHFILEDDLWEYYCLLPGECMSLMDRSTLMPM